MNKRKATISIRTTIAEYQKYLINLISKVKKYNSAILIYLNSKIYVSTQIYNFYFKFLFNVNFPI